MKGFTACSNQVIFRPTCVSSLHLIMTLLLDKNRKKIFHYIIFIHVDHLIFIRVWQQIERRRQHLIRGWGTTGSVRIQMNHMLLSFMSSIYAAIEAFILYAELKTKLLSTPISYLAFYCILNKLNGCVSIYWCPCKVYCIKCFYYFV